MKARARGFTLVEMMVVVVIMAILVAIGVPSFQQMIASQKVKTAASRLQSALVLTRSEALKRNTNITLAPATAGQWAAGWKILDPTGGADLASYGEIKAITVTGPASVIYQASGRVNGAAASFKFASPNTPEIRCVAVSLSGVPTVTTSGC